jgi:hypothetical protein
MVGVLATSGSRPTADAHAQPIRESPTPCADLVRGHGAEVRRLAIAASRGVPRGGLREAAATVTPFETRSAFSD